MSLSSAIAALQCELMSSKGTQKGEEYLQSSNHQAAATPYNEPQQSSGYEKYWPQIDEVYMKGMISLSPDSCIFPYVEKH